MSQKIKKKSTFIDMTAMSDVTVLLLTFFMLTSTFIQKEPVQVNPPQSVSEIKIPESNIVSILVEPTGKVFMGLDKPQDRIEVLKKMGIDNKKWVYQVSEGKRYLFLWWLNLKAFSSAWRGYNESHMALYDKQTGETVAIAGDGLIDDIDNGMTFFPQYGICNNAMVSSVWPFELKEYIQKKAEKGESVSNRLIALADSLDDEENPILIIAHLKQ